MPPRPPSPTVRQPIAPARIAVEAAASQKRRSPWTRSPSQPRSSPATTPALGEVVYSREMEVALDPSAIEARLAEFFAAEAERQGIAAAYLFGSVARGTAGKRSDVDVAVLYEGEPPPGFAGLGIPLAGDLERRLGRPVDVVVLNRAPADLVHRVLRDGHLLVDRDRSRRIAFEVQSRNEYFDLLPHLRRYRRMGGESR
jgi:uncharacterized protein